MPRPIHPDELLDVDGLKDKTGLGYDAVYDLMRDEATLGRRLGFKLGRRWYVHPDDWDEFLAARRGVDAGRRAS